MGLAKKFKIKQPTKTTLEQVKRKASIKGFKVTKETGMAFKGDRPPYKEGATEVLDGPKDPRIGNNGFHFALTPLEACEGVSVVSGGYFGPLRLWEIEAKTESIDVECLLELTSLSTDVITMTKKVPEAEGKEKMTGWSGRNCRRGDGWDRSVYRYFSNGRLAAVVNKLHQTHEWEIDFFGEFSGRFSGARAARFPTLKAAQTRVMREIDTYLKPK